VFFCAGLLLACKKEKDDAPEPATGNGQPAPVPVDSVCYANTVAPFLTASCAVPGCHVAGGTGPALLSYEDVMDFVVPADTAASSILTVAIHWSDDSLTVAYMDSVTTWIMQGALNNDCD
jgi:hypothetical protein